MIKCQCIEYSAFQHTGDPVVSQLCCCMSIGEAPVVMRGEDYQVKAGRIKISVVNETIPVKSFNCSMALRKRLIRSMKQQCATGTEARDGAGVLRVVVHPAAEVLTRGVSSEKTFPPV
mmetsp:Transcript_20867/g.62800  ORF Transcript_20867/g.62800 Transcript_20867/m.62800 type:complete len:118 (+) Transcript_20867:1883-2236(+)